VNVKSIIAIEEVKGDLDDGKSSTIYRKLE